MAGNDDQTGDFNDLGLSRRNLVRAATGGFVLAASGLLLPATVGEAEAREGALDGQLGGRRGPNQRGRGQRKRRDRGDDKNKNRDGSRGVFRTTALTVNTTVQAGLDLTFSAVFYYRTKTGRDRYGPWLVGRDGDAVSDRFAPGHYRVGVLLSTVSADGQGVDLFIDVRNLRFDFPRGAANVGFGLDPTRNNLGQALYGERDFAEGEAEAGGSYVINVERSNPRSRGAVTLTRNVDSQDFVEFEVSVTAR